jgi:hypothetical protein
MPLKDARMHPRNLFRSAALALAVSLTLGAPSAFAADRAATTAAATAVQCTAVARGLHELAFSSTQPPLFVAFLPTSASNVREM